MAQTSIPGDPAGLGALASQLRLAASDVDAVQGRVASNGLQGSWSGRAADAFRSSLHELPGELAKIVAAFNDSGQALSSFASKLAELQQQAHWYARHVEGAEREQQEANARHAQAQTKLAAARLAHSAATDPISLRTAQNAVDLGESAVSQAAADLEEIGGNISRLVSGAQSVRGEYEDAVRVCCSTLDAARHSGGRSLVASLDNRVHQLAGHVGHDFAAWWRDGSRAARDVGRDAEKEWPHLRNVLEDAKKPLEEVGLALGATALVIGAFLGLDEVAGVVGAAAIGLSRVILAIDALITGGDTGEAVSHHGSYSQVGNDAETTGKDYLTKKLDERDRAPSSKDPRGSVIRYGASTERDRLIQGAGDHPGRPANTQSKGYGAGSRPTHKHQITLPLFIPIV